MRLTREQATFLVVVALLALLGYFSFLAEAPGPAGNPSPRSKDLPASSALEPNRSKIGRAEFEPGKRDPFAAPRDTTPLPPLPLDPPPLDPLPILAPPAPPGGGVKAYAKFYRTPYAPVRGVFPSEEDLNGGPAEPEEEKPKASAKPKGAPASPTRPAPLSSEEKAKRIEGYKAQYDWYRSGLSHVFGRIVNRDRFRLRETARLEEQLEFVPVDPEKGVPLSNAPVSIEREQNGQTVEFGFADTAANRIEIGFLGLRYAAGNLPDLLAFAEACVEMGMDEPKGFERAEEVYGRVIALDPEDPAGALGLGRLYERTFRLEEAWKHYAAMAEGKFARRAEPRVRLAELAARLRLFERAEAEFRGALELAPSSAEALSAFGEFLLARGRAAEAASECEAAFRLEPPAPAARARIRLALGRARLAAGDAEGARRAFEAALEVAAGSPEASAGVGAAAYAAGNFSAAVEACSKGLASGAETLDLYAGRGLSRLRTALGRSKEEAAPLFREARKDLEAASSLDPLRAHVPLAGLAFLLEMGGKTEEAFEALERAYENDPTAPYVLYLRARTLRSRGDVEGSKEALEAALDAELDFPDALAERGLVALSEERPGDAERYLARAVSLSPGEAAFETLLGFAILRVGAPRRAEERFKQAIQLDRESGPARNGLGVCAYAQGDTEGALRAFSEVIDRFKNRPESPHGRYAKEAFDRINDHKSKVEWTDEFDRGELRRGWVADSQGGLTERIVNGRVAIEGTAKGEGETRLYREIAGRDFVSLEVTLTVGAESQAAACGILVSAETRTGASRATNFRVDVARRRDGEVATRVRENPREEPTWKPHPDAVWPVGVPVRLSIERLGTSEDPRLRVTLDGEPLLDWLQVREFRGTGGGMYAVGAFAEMEGAGRSADLSVDSVRIIYREKGK